MKKKNVITFKSLLYILFLSLCLCQENFSSKLYKYYKFNDTKSINIFDLINENTGVFKVQDFSQIEKTIIYLFQKCLFVTHLVI